MAKIIKKIAILLIPIALYYAVFIAFEPNNYFGIRKQAAGSDIMGKLRSYSRTKENNIILGDSRSAKFDTEQVKEITGKDFANLGYGGASLKEQLDVLDWALQVNPSMETVVFDISFYTLNKAYSPDRNILMALNNPFVYMTNLSYNMNMITNLTDHLRSGGDPSAIGDKGETMEPADFKYIDFINPVTGETVKMRETLAANINGMNDRVKNWSLNQQQFDRLLETIDKCTEKGILFVVALLPVHDEVHNQLVVPYGIDVQMVPVLEQLHASPALFLDYEFENRPPLRDDQFFDGIHLDEKRGLPEFTEIMFGDIKAAIKEQA